MTNQDNRRMDFRRRALRAALAVSFTGAGVSACAGQIVIDQASAGGGNELIAQGSGGNGGNGGNGGSGVLANAGGAGGVAEDAGGAVVVDASIGTDAGCDCTAAPDPDACCVAVEWSFDCGCMAWGPPMPPSMDIA